MHILIVGAGATGGYFGGRLAQAGRDVTFLVRPRRAEQLRADGLRIVSPYGDFTVRPKLVTAHALSAGYDAILLTVKAYALDAALDDLSPAVGADTMILPVLNGMRHIDVIRQRFGARSLAGCVCKVATTLDDRGRIHQLNGMHSLAYGEMSGETSPRIAELDRQMQGAVFDARLSAAIEREMWEKWILLASLGSITCLARGNIGQIEAALGGIEFAGRLLDEVVSVISAVGKKPADAFLAETRSLLTQRGSAQTSSMFRDLQQGNRIEADQIVGDLVTRARAAGIATPLLSAALVNLSVYQQTVPTGG